MKIFDVLKSDTPFAEAVADVARRTFRPEQAAIVIAGPYEES